VYPLKELRKIQRRAAIWILGAFHTLPSPGVETIAGLLPIQLYLQKLSGRFQLKMHMLLLNHVIKLLLKSRHTKDFPTHQFSLKRLTPK